MNRTALSGALLAVGLTAPVWSGFNGLNMSVGNLATLSDAKSRCISPENPPENPTGEPDWTGR